MICGGTTSADGVTMQKRIELDDVPTGTPREAAEYVEQSCEVLIGLAEQCGMGFLGYLLALAREEAAAAKHNLEQ